MNNIVLIGMPASGKSTVGVLLAKALLYDFLDTDLILQLRCGMSLCRYIEKHGTDAFIHFEEETISALQVAPSSAGPVIETGGSVVYGERAMQHLAKCAKIVYLRAPIEELRARIGNIRSRGVVLTHGSTLADLFSERQPLYERYAQITVDTAKKSPEQIVSELLADIR